MTKTELTHQETLRHWVGDVIRLFDNLIAEQQVNKIEDNRMGISLKGALRVRPERLHESLTQIKMSGKRVEAGNDEASIHKALGKCKIIAIVGPAGIGKTVDFKSINLSVLNLVKTPLFQPYAEQRLDAMKQTVRILASLSRPNVLSVRDYGFNEENLDGKINCMTGITAQNMIITVNDCLMYEARKVMKNSWEKVIDDLIWKQALKFYQVVTCEDIAGNAWEWAMREPNDMKSIYCSLSQNHPRCTYGIQRYPRVRLRRKFNLLPIFVIPDLRYSYATGTIKRLQLKLQSIQYAMTNSITVVRRDTPRNIEGNNVGDGNTAPDYKVANVMWETGIVVHSKHSFLGDGRVYSVNFAVGDVDFTPDVGVLTFKPAEDVFGITAVSAACQTEELTITVFPVSDPPVSDLAINDPDLLWFLNHHIVMQAEVVGRTGGVESRRNTSFYEQWKLIEIPTGEATPVHMRKRNIVDLWHHDIRKYCHVA